MIEINEHLQIPLRELRFSFARSSGPGGQNVNKVNSKATLHWSVVNCEALPEPVRVRFMQQNKRRINNDGDVVIHSQRFRDQGRNVADCIEKLRALLVIAAEAPTYRKPTRPTKGSKRRRLNDKKATGEKKRLRQPPPRE
ncbi:alternative ribosome rescue aminoacyl-tRNA hydrolase ArfB [Lignipirellula cremea]|uniref:Peptidyl-tRNA hydrolase ArfB n=1 Tax=Lignipirellula cremea TaxID=2528010 RepID=A0A518DRE8_9BACT|nr:alternative ribosome rescue aminoacyl-tRNA hydrolase ArfB [Lignipirellula cremea]QDU94417.1 Peptidyl-tRNA hydrolase ArfB [Lignipirellula cremea]